MGNPIRLGQLPHSEYRIGNILITFQSSNAVPTIVKGKDLVEAIGGYISAFSNPLSTGVIIILLAIPFWLVGRFAQITVNELASDHFYHEQDRETICTYKMGLFPSGRFYPDSRFKKNTQLYKILASADLEVASEPSRLVAHCKDNIYTYFYEMNDRLSESFGAAGVLALSLGLLGTVIGMIDAFDVLEETIKLGGGPAQTQLKMAHHINFALITTALGFGIRILAMALLHLSKKMLIQNRDVMVEMVEHFNPAINGDEE